jgi:predicted O-methyltransferase YrrM
MDLFSSLRYIQYSLFSRHRKGHGIHSPFVFSLVSEVFRNKIDPDIVCSIEKIRKKLISDPRSIEVNDLGAGSAKMKTNIRKVSDIARYSAVPRKYGIFVSNMARAFGEPLIVEFGTSIGISTMYMASASGDTPVYTMEGCSATSSIAEENFREAGLTKIKLMNGPFEDLLSGIKSEKISPGLVFIDGNHRREPVINYFNQVAEMAESKTVVIIDDINSSREMAEAWSVIKDHGNVTFTIDIFRMGIAFFRKGMPRFHYVIRY